MAPVPSWPIKVGHIDDVQELRKAKPTTIPERFVREVAERPKLAATPPSATDIPIIDLSKLMTRDKGEHQTELLQLKTACEEWGFFQVLKMLHFLFIYFHVNCFFFFSEEEKKMIMEANVLVAIFRYIIMGLI